MKNKMIKWVAQAGNGSYIFDKKPVPGEMCGVPTFGFTDGTKCEEISTDAANKFGATYGKCIKVTIEEEIF